jgi:hypothetical protein
MKDMTRKSDFTRKLGDAIEKIGERLTKLGAAKLGNAVYNAGDRLEHKNDVVTKRPIVKDV